MKTTRQNSKSSKAVTPQWEISEEAYSNLERMAKQAGVTIDEMGNECLRLYFKANPVKPKAEKTVRVVTVIPVSKVKPFVRWKKGDLDPVGLAMNADGQPMLCLFQEDDPRTVQACIPIPLHEAVDRLGDAMDQDTCDDFDWSAGMSEFFSVVAKALEGKASR